MKLEAASNGLGAQSMREKAHRPSEPLEPRKKESTNEEYIHIRRIAEETN